jgi:hypothetical protein
VELQGSRVLKTYYAVDGPQIVTHLSKIYRLLVQKEVPNTDLLFHHSTAKHLHSVPYILTYPLGGRGEPGDRTEILDAVKCVLRTLIVCPAFFLLSLLD